MPFWEKQYISKQKKILICFNFNLIEPKAQICVEYTH